MLLMYLTAIASARARLSLARSRTDKISLCSSSSLPPTIEETNAFLADASWVGIIPGYRHFSYNTFASAGTGGSGVNYDYDDALLAVHSGPSLYEDPLVIHPPNSPLGHTDEMYALHPGGGNVLLGDGSVKFIKQEINLLVWQALCSRQGGEVISAESY